MTNYKQLKKNFLNLSHEDKKAKVKEIVNRLRDWSEFFVGISDMFENPDIKDISDSILIYIYNLVINMAIQNQSEKINKGQQILMQNIQKIQNIRNLEKNESDQDLDSMLSQIL